MSEPEYDPNDINQWSERTREGVEVPDEVEGSKLVEVPPQVTKPTRQLSDRAKEFLARNKTVPTRSAKKITGTRSKANKPRTSVEKFIGRTWEFMSRAALPFNPPVSRVLAMQAPVAGLILEDVVRNTVVDKVLQPLARVGNGGEVAFALMGPPLLIGMLQIKPESAVFAIPLLKESLRAWIDIAGPKLDEVMDREKKFQEQYGTRIDEMIGYFLGIDPELLNQAPIFEPPVMEPEVTPIKVTKARVRRAPTTETG